MRGRACFERLFAAYDPEQHQAVRFMYHGFDPAVAALGNLSHILASLGFLHQAMERAEQGVAHARRIEHPLSEATALYFAMLCFIHRGEHDRAGPHVQAVLRVAHEHGFFLLVVWAQAVEEMLLYASGDSKGDPRTIEDSIAQIRGTGYLLGLPMALNLFAMAHWRAGRLDAALAVLDDTSAEIERTGERNFEPPMKCLRGEVQLSLGAPAEAEACFREALEVARHQKARLWELRAATHLARLWKNQGERDQARELLAPIYEWFTEGFDTLPLHEAKALLEELSD